MDKVTSFHPGKKRDFTAVSHCYPGHFCLLSLPACSCPSTRSPGIFWDQALGYRNPPLSPLPAPSSQELSGGPLTTLPTYLPLLNGHVSVSVGFNQGFLAFYPKTTGNGGSSAFRRTYFTLRVHLLNLECSDLYSLQTIFLSLPRFSNPQYWGENGSGHT